MRTKRAGVQGPGELGLGGIPTPVISARDDTMAPARMRAMAERLPRGRYVEYANGSHLAMCDDANVYLGRL